MENNRFLGSISSSSIKNLFPRSASSKQIMKKSSPLNPNSQNIPPIDPNIQISDPPPLPSNSFSKISLPKPTVIQQESTRSAPELNVATASVAPVKVVVRVRPSESIKISDSIVKKVSEDTVSVGDRKFSFDSVFDASSSQDDLFQKIGVPLVDDALAGYNASILAYGQTGSGKSYTMWGPPSAMVEDPSAGGSQGIVPRIFEMLFSKMQQDKDNSEGRQINYQCRCSFFEIYNGEIGDLLDVTQRNLEMKEDAKYGVYVENLTEEYVTSYEDVTQMLIKGLSSRKVGATSTNSKSSRSHIVFTCIIESWCKETSSKCFGSSKTSRINLVDLAGFERNTSDGASKQCMKEGKFVKKSTSHLGNLINLIATRSHLETSEGLPYGNSSLTQFLKESLGGNAKLCVICAVFPDQKYSNETASTLRLGKQVKLVRNKPIINEITEDDVNDLSDQIRQLKEELTRARSSVSESVQTSPAYFNRRSVRDSLNQLRLSLNRSLILPNIDGNTATDLHASEDDVKELGLQLKRLHSSCDEDAKDSEEFCETDLASEKYISCSDESETDEPSFVGALPECIKQNEVSTVDDLDHTAEFSGNPALRSSSSIAINARRQSEVLQGPILSESPKLKNTNRKSLIFMSEKDLPQMHDAPDISKSGPQERSDVIRLPEQDETPAICSNGESVAHSIKHTENVRSSMRSSKILPGSTESLAASLHRGLQIIEYHQQNSRIDRSSVSFSFDHFAVKQPCTRVDKANSSSQTSLCTEQQSSDLSSIAFLCRNCQKRETIASTEVQDSMKTWTDSPNEEKKISGVANQMPLTNANTTTLGRPTNRESELENVIKEQEVKIEELNQQLKKYKLQEDQNTTNSIERFQKSPTDQHELLLLGNGNEKRDLEVIKEEGEIKQTEGHMIHSLNFNEREALLKEIAILRSKLPVQADGTSVYKSTDRIRSSLLAQSIQLRKSGSLTRANSLEEFEKERERWTEMESEWICLTDELRIDLESQRERGEKLEMELRLEKKITEELDDVLKRSILGHARMVEHYADLQEKYNELAEKHRLVLEGVAEVKRAVAKAGAKKGCNGYRFSKSLAAELSNLRVERKKEVELLRKENASLKLQLRDTAEAVHAAGELLVRLREAEETASVAEGNLAKMQEENEKLKKQIEKLRRKHKMEMITMKQYLEESRLPESAIRALHREDSDIVGHNDTSGMQVNDEDEAWRAEFGAIYQEHY